MKKVIKKAWFLIMIMSFCMVCFSGCFFQENSRILSNEYFIYIVKDNGNEIRIVGLTDKGKEQEYLIIPNEISGKKVSNIGCSNNLIMAQIENEYGSYDYIQIQSENLKKIFIMSDVVVMKNSWVVGDGIQNCPNLEGLFYLLKKEYESANAFNDLPFNESPANVSYFYNYDNAPNDNYYWIDDYDYGEKIDFIPPEPTRAGYTFGGWYKESECINKWNFEIDALPSALYGEDNLELYQETKLYAKWIEIGE